MRRVMRQAIAATAGAAVGLALLAASAQAGWRIDRALAVAGVVWNHPCGDQIEVRWARLPDDIGGQVTLGDCALTVNTIYPWSWQGFCRTVIHEVGHIAGMPHSTDPRSVMWGEQWASMDAVLINGEWVSQRDRRCRDRGRPYLERHGLL